MAHRPPTKVRPLRRRPHEPHEPTPGSSESSEFRRGERGLLLAVAGISALTGILGATVGGFFAYEAADLQSQAAAHAAQTQSHAAAVLAERQELKETYANYLTGLGDLGETERQLSEAVKAHAEGSADEEIVKRDFDTWYDEFGKWTKQDEILSLVVSPQLFSIESQIVSAHNEILTIFNTFQDMPAGDTLSHLPDLNYKIEEALALRTDFRDVARTDLDRLGYGDH
jgi:hypothetical protein